MQPHIQWQWSLFEQLRVTELYAALRLRQEVFVVEQNCPFLDVDGLDPVCRHLLGWDNAQLAAYLRVIPAGVKRSEVVISRVVVGQAWRTVGLGRAIMLEAMRRIDDTLGVSPLYLSGQEYLLRFYESLGFNVCGPGYLEDGIPHVPMTRPAVRPDRIPPAAASP